MSEFVEVEWFGREDKIGIVLTYSEFDGFKARMGPVSWTHPWDDKDYEQQDIDFLMKNAAKIPFEWAWGIFGKRMVSEWHNRHGGQNVKTVRYDHRDYDIKTLEEVG